MTNFQNPIEVQTDAELMASRRAFPTAQQLLAGGVLRVVADVLNVGWHDSSEHPETGAVALVSENGELVDLVGEVVQVTRYPVATGAATCAVYVVGSGDLEADIDISLSRRAFLSLGLLSLESLPCRVEVIA